MPPKTKEEIEAKTVQCTAIIMEALLEKGVLTRESLANMNAVGDRVAEFITQLQKDALL